MIDSYARMAFELTPQPPTEEDIESAIERLRPTAHREVKDRAVWWFGQWGENAIPQLIQAFERADEQRTEWLARALGATRSPQAVDPLRQYLEDQARAGEITAGRWVRPVWAAAEALAQIGADEAIQALISFHRQTCQSCSVVLEAIAKVQTQTTTDYVLEVFSRTPPERAPITWALAYTRDERGAQALAGLLRHPEFDTRMSARSAAGQVMGAEALEPFFEAFLAGPDDFVRYDALDVLSSVVGREPHAGLIAVLIPLLEHPIFSSLAFDILSRMRAPELIAVLQETETLDPDRIALFGAVAQPLIEQRFASPDPDIRADAVWLLRRLYLPRDEEVLVWARRFHYADPDIHWARSRIEASLADPDARVRRVAEENLPRLDRAILLASFAETMPKSFGIGAWYNAGPPHNDGFEILFHLLSWMHLAGLIVSLVLGLQLLCNSLRIFEPYRFKLFIQFLLAEGFVGDFFFLLDDSFWYLAATAIHLLLLIGFLSKESERLPNQARNRFERLGGASLWVLVPLVLYLGTPLLAEGLRLVFRSFADLWPHLVVLALLSALVFEQAIWSSDLFRRPAWLERLLSLGLSAAVLALPIQALRQVSEARKAGSDADGAALALFLIVPLGWVLILHIVHARIHETLFSARRIVRPPGKRMQASIDGKTVSILFLPIRSQKSRLIRGVCKTVMIGGVGFVAAYVAGSAGKADAMVLALISGFAGSALAGLVLQWFQRRVLFQIREGYARTAETTFGGVGRRSAPWQRHPLLPAHTRKLLAQQYAAPPTNRPLSQTELRWLNSIVAGGNGGGRAGHAVRRSAVRLIVQPPLDLPDTVSFLPVEIQLENRSNTPVRVGGLEDVRAGWTWRAEIDGSSADLFLNGGERDKLIVPGGSVVCQAKIFPDKVVSNMEQVRIQLSCGDIRSEPVWYGLTTGDPRACA